MKNERRYDIDILKSTALLFMIASHVNFGSQIHTYFASFYMPLFFIVSGFLFKEGRSYKVVIKKKIKTLLVPYLFFLVIWLIVLKLFILTDLMKMTMKNAIFAGIVYPTDIAHYPLAPAMWFLPTFFVSSVLYEIIQDKIENFALKTILILIIAVGGVYYSSLNDKMLPFGLEPATLGLGFMHLGYLMKRIERPKIWISLLLFFAGIYIAFINVECDMRSACYGNVLFYLGSSVCNTYAWWGISYWWVPKIIKKNSFFSYMSANAIVFICTNQPIILILQNLSEIIIKNQIGVMLIVIRIIILIITVLLGYITSELLLRTKLRVILGKF